MNKILYLFLFIALFVSCKKDNNSYLVTKENVLETMHALSPLPDITNTPQEVWEEAAEATVQAHQEMPWGNIIPEREFLHFVVPLRVNNEPIDGHRPIIYAELKDRVKNLSMEEAILEVNHWCHEYVSYQPSDSRTHSALQSMSSLIGRCGEESTFTVSALRAVGIPARQVYTPRWAHTDDNHAWVEAWADGEWHFIGACEPEAVLDLGWFNAPATRGMMMHTFVRGNYDGPEAVVDSNDEGVTINITTNYAPTDTTVVTVLNANGQPAVDATVSFMLYNYGEFYPIAKLKTNAEGQVTCSTGKGDIIVWATNSQDYAWTQTHAGDNVEITLEGCPSDSRDYVLVPPRPGSNIVAVDSAKNAANIARLQAEDALRAAKAAKFASNANIDSIAQALSVDPQRLRQILQRARGNGWNILGFVESQPVENRAKALLLFESISEKDVSDIPVAVMEDHIKAQIDKNDKFNATYVMSPRINSEQLTPWRSPLATALSDISSECKANPKKWRDIVEEEIEIIPNWNPAFITMDPYAAWQTKKTNVNSRNVLFVAGARAMGIPSRIDPVTNKPQWHDGKGWIEAAFTSNENVAPATCKGKVQLVPDAKNVITNPAYYMHFTISQIVDGQPRLLEFGESDNFVSQFAKPIELGCGDYMLVTGQRLADGTVLTHTEFFTISSGKTTKVPLIINRDENEVDVIGTFDSEGIYHDNATDTDKSLLSSTGRGYYVVAFLRSHHEPSVHILRDMAQLKSELEATNVPIVFLCDAPTEEIMTQLGETTLPETVIFGRDPQGKLLDGIVLDENPINKDDVHYPVILIADTFNRVVFANSGYTIGIGQRVLDTLKKVNQHQ